jgi:hypothetical protein
MAETNSIELNPLRLDGWAPRAKRSLSVQFSGLRDTGKQSLARAAPVRALAISWSQPLKLTHMHEGGNPVSCPAGRDIKGFWAPAFAGVTVFEFCRGF